MAMRTRKGRGTKDPERDAVVARLFDGVLRSARNHLVHAEAPLAAEVWASGLLSVWQSNPVAADDADAGDAFGEALVRHARSEGTAEAAATLWALAGVVPMRLATKARTAAADLERSGVAAPSWVAGVGASRPTEAWVGRDVYGDQEIVIVGYAYPAGDGDGAAAGDREHTVCVLIDHNLAGMAKDAYLAGPLPATLARWRDAEALGVTLEPITLAEAAGRLEDALLATEIDGEAAATRLADLRALLAARLEALPAPDRPGAGELDLDTRERLVAEFVSSPEAAELLVEPAMVGICHSLVAFRADHGDGEPLRWSPRLASACLLRHFPTHGGLDEADVALVPDVLVAWARFAGRRRHLPEAATARVVAAVDACRADFAAAMRGTLDPGARLSVC